MSKDLYDDEFDDQGYEDNQDQGTDQGQEDEDYLSDPEITESDEDSFSDDSFVETTEEPSNIDKIDQNLYIETADEYLRICGLPPCAKKWNKMPLEQRREIEMKLCKVRDDNPNDPELIKNAGNALFFLNYRFFFSNAHRKMSKSADRLNDYAGKVQSALTDMWEFCNEKFITSFDPTRSMYCTYMANSRYKISQVSLGINTYHISEQTQYKFDKIRQAENEILKLYGDGAATDTALELKTGFPKKIIQDYRAWSNTKHRKELDDNMVAPQQQVEKAEHMRNPESVVAEKDQEARVMQRVYELFPDFSDIDIGIIEMKLGFKGSYNADSIATYYGIGKEYVSDLWNKKARNKLQRDPIIASLVPSQKLAVKKSLQQISMNTLEEDTTIGLVGNDEIVYNPLMSDGQGLNFGGPSESDNGETLYVETEYNIVSPEEVQELADVEVIRPEQEPVYTTGKPVRIDTSKERESTDMEKEVIIDTIDSVDMEQEAEEQKPKKRGRPRGAKNKQDKETKQATADTQEVIPESNEVKEEAVETEAVETEAVISSEKNEAVESIETPAEEAAAPEHSPECENEVHDMVLKADAILSVNTKKEEEMTANISKVDEFISWAKASGMNTDQIAAGTTKEYEKYVTEKEKAIKRSEIANKIKALLEELKSV